ncbi:MAG TPA: SDR family NAD(P)-dependent oxidoreductase [Acidimicrobiales bacterium]|nr:SDR family NAD(P)-dependent oxidoreductase [Acidimicrobiales bacterium]
MRFAGKVAIVTGAGSGIGEAAARLFAREGARVVVADVSRRKAQATAAAILDGGGEALGVEVDVRSSDGCEAMVAAAVDTWGRLDVLYNNAGTTRPGSAPDLSEDDWDLVLDTNLKAVWLGCKFAIPEMRKVGGGAIVNTASVEGLVGDRASVAYCASKAGVVNLTRCIAVDHAHENIRANCVCPGVIGTPPILRWLVPDEATRDDLGRRHPLGRLGTPEEVAAVALFLASDEASFLTGAAVPVDGGLIAESGIAKPR